MSLTLDRQTLLTLLAGAAIGGGAVYLATRVRARDVEGELRTPKAAEPASKADGRATGDGGAGAPPSAAPEMARQASDFPSLNWRKYGVISDLKLRASLPFELKPASYTTEGHGVRALAAALGSRQLRETTQDVLRTRVVSGLEDEGVTFENVCELILAMGNTSVYVFGGFVRDAMLGVVAEDIDILFRSTSGNVVAYLERVATQRSWPCYKKTDEKTGQTRWDFIALGTKGAKSKFSGHPIGSGCEGDFACNMLLYDVHTGSLIDPTGHGVADSVDFVLRIPYPKAYWDEWMLNDRLTGMKLLRYFNFCGRGYVPASQDMREWIVEQTQKLFKTHKAQMVTTATTFLKRKVFTKDIENAVARQKTYRGAVLREFVAAGVPEADAKAWIRDNFTVLFPSVRKNTIPGLHAALEAALSEEAE